MSVQKYTASIKGLLPGIDRRKLNEPYIMEGQNFLMTLDGPVSGLGRKIIGYKSIYKPTNVQTFKVIETQESYVCTPEGIFRFNTVSQKLDTLVLLSAVLTAEFPWSMAAVGNKYYFVNQDSGLIEFDIVNDSWQIVSGGSIPINIYACTESEGRLILLTDSVSAWSAIGDGQDFTPSTTTGAGSQVLTKLGLSNPKPLGVQKVPDGFLTFLSSGIMKSQAIQAANPFRHTVLSKEHIVLNPFCITLINAQKIVFATTAGLFETDGKIPVVYQPLMSAYLHENIFVNLDTVNNRNSVRLYSDFNRAWFLVSVAMNQQDFVYDIAYLLNINTQEWGSFNDAHVAFFDFETLQQNQSGFNHCVLTADGSISRFDNSTGIEYIPAEKDGMYFHGEPVDAYARENSAQMIFTCRMNLRTVSTAKMPDTGVYNEFHEVEEFLSPLSRDIQEKETVDVAGVLIFKCNTDYLMGGINIDVQRQSPFFNGLNASVLVGLYRLTDELTADRLSYITNANIGMLSDAAGTVYEDWMSDVEYPTKITEDWLTMPDENVDWGGDPVLSTLGDPKIISSLDGYTPDENQVDALNLVRADGKIKFYSCYSSGLYHAYQFDAFEIGENFAIKTIDMTMNLGGRI